MTAFAVVSLGPDLEALEAVLVGADLPVTDLREPGRSFFRFEDAAGTVGFAGLEGTGADRLLRSVVILRERRGVGLGAAVTKALEAAAAKMGVVTLYLLTTDAAPFFAEQGYEIRERSGAPDAIRASHEFTSLCPDSATCMAKVISA